MLGPAATVRLFGSRVDDAARGGDIDLLLESNTLIEQPAGVAAPIGALLQRALGDQCIDVVIAAPNVQRPLGSQRPLGIAVGTPITERPPHRSVHAQLTHSAPTLGV